jgi:hypothetical protein
MSKPAQTSFHVLIPAAGSGSRTGLDTPKQYAVIGGKAILRHTIEKFIGLSGLASSLSTLPMKLSTGAPLPALIFPLLSTVLGHANKAFITG